MPYWSADELSKIEAADDLHVAPFRDDGTTYGTPTWIWAVTVDGSLYVRAYNAQDSRWYQAARSQRAGRVTAARTQHEVTFEPVNGLLDGPTDDDMDAAYRTKYAGSSYLDPMVSPRARSATVVIAPRGDT